MALVVRNDTLAALAGADGDYAPIQVDASGAVYMTLNNTLNQGNADASTIRVAIADDDTLLTTIDADTGAIKTAVEIMDDWDDGSDHCEVVGAAAEDAAVSGAPVLAGGRYDTTERTLDNGDAGALALSAEGWAMVGNQSSYLFDGVTRCEIKRKSAVMASTGTVLSAVVGKKFRILALFLKATSATVTNVWLGTTTDTDVLGNTGNPIPLAVDADGDNDSGFVLPYNQGGWTETSTANEALTLTMSAAQDVIYAITYIEVA
jgi:hypothetical protein